MYIMMKKISSQWIIGLFVFFSVAVSSGNVTVAPGIGTTTVNALSAFTIDIKITNRIYNDSLKDHQSLQYRILREEVENVFSTTFRYSPSMHYQGISEMTFSNGSVIASSITLFGIMQINEAMVKKTFADNYERHPVSMLDLNVSYTKGAKPNVATIPMILEQNTVPTPSSHFNTSQLLNTSTHVTITNATTTHLTIANASTTHTTITNASTTHTTITNASTSHTTITSASTSHTTITSASTTSNSKFRESPTTTLGITTSQSTTRDHNTPKTSHTPISDKTTLTSDNMTVPPHNLTSLTSTTIPSSRPTSPASPAEPNRVAPSEHMAPASAAAGAAEAEQGVPGWGIALLVLAAFILFLFLVLLILLLLCWCCCWRTRGFVNMSDPTPIGYYNPDIPMYSTHSTYDSHNGTPLTTPLQKPTRNRTGKYPVNQ